MDTQLPIDLGQIAHELHLPVDRVHRTVELLDEGNTVPFITRYRREQTGGFEEEQIRLVAEAVKRRRQLLERKQTILKTIESQSRLTPELQRDIEQANNLKRLEDLYLPYKPKKQTLATQARERGLEPLALEILNGEPLDLEARLTELVNPEKGIATTTEVLEGVQHLVAEKISERADLRGRLRRIFFRSGRLICTKIEKPADAPESVQQDRSASDSLGQESSWVESPEGAATGDGGESQLADASAAVEQSSSNTSSEAAEAAIPTVDAEASSVNDAEVSDTEVSDAEVSDTEVSDTEVSDAEASDTHVTTPAEPAASDNAAPSEQPELSENEPVAAEAGLTDANVQGVIPPEPASDLPPGRLFERPQTPIMAPVEQKKKKKKKKKVTDNAFKDYFDFQEPLTKLPPHRTLAINRGERANVLRVKIEADVDAMLREADEVVVLPDHLHREFLYQCVRDALTRLILPSLEREARRELSERAEGHAVEVFVRNLRKLLLQPPVHARRVLAIDPGFKSGCKMAALDEWGNVLAHGLFFVVGRDERREKARAKIAELIRNHDLSVIAIGNGTASRDTEQLVADMLSNELKDRDVAYVTVNEAGASVYSTSPLGREELPTHDAILRSAVSIGRRLLDPLSELVKINPANIGVGMYQHDMKAKHLKESLDAVVESAVNFVGVDVNTASPALLRYVSGLNALTARRIYEYRREHGPFTNREDLKKVPSVGESTFVQAAGFLKVLGGDNALDATWIHPESYDLAKRVLERFGSSVEELAEAVPTPVAPPERKETPKFGEGLIDDQTPPTETDEVAEQSLPDDDALQQAAEGALQTEEAIVTAALNETPSDDQIAELMPHEFGQDEAVGTNEPIDAPIANDTPPTPAALPEPVPPKPNPIAEKFAQIDIMTASHELGVSPLLLDDIIVSLARPGRDPREELPPPMFRRGIMKLEDLQAGMELQGTVLNVVDFGAFVDIGLSDSGLVHISRLADRYIRDPHEVVGVGDILKLWVVEVDRGRRRVSLTAIAPGSERPAPRREERPQRAPRSQQSPGPRARQDAAGGPPSNAQSGGREGQRAGGGGGQGGGGQANQHQGQGGQARGGQYQGRGGDGRSGDNRGGAGRGGDGRGNQGGGNQGQAGPPRQRQDRRPQRGGGGPPRHDQGPRIVERPATKPKVVKPITKAQEDGKQPLRSFSDLLQLMDKKKDKKPGDATPPPPPAE